MKPYQLFSYLRKAKYLKTGKDLDWNVDVLPKEKEIRVRFRESCSKLDWVFNFMFMIIPTIIGACPYWFSIGWWISYNSSRQLIMASILSAIATNPDYKVHVCGFSFGGAVAQICGIDIYKKAGIKPDITTFGSPRPLFNIFTKLKAKAYFNNVKQYAHWSDIVTWCPPLIGYHTIKNTRIGKFSFKLLFNPSKTHQMYDDKTLYSEDN